MKSTIIISKVRIILKLLLFIVLLFVLKCIGVFQKGKTDSETVTTRLFLLVIWISLSEFEKKEIEKALVATKRFFKR